MQEGEKEGRREAAFPSQHPSSALRGPCTPRGGTKPLPVFLPLQTLASYLKTTECPVAKPSDLTSPRPRAGQGKGAEQGLDCGYLLSACSQGHASENSRQPGIRWEDQEFKGSLGYTGSSRPARGYRLSHKDSTSATFSSALPPSGPRRQGSVKYKPRCL